MASLCETLQKPGPGLFHNTVYRVTGQLHPWLNSHKNLLFFSGAVAVNRVALVPRTLCPYSQAHCSLLG